jgi:hypothetical protein
MNVNFRFIKIICLLLALTIGQEIGSSKNKPLTVTKLYQSSRDNFPNPERGFYYPFNPSNDNLNAPPLELDELAKLRAKNITLIRKFYLLAEFKDRPISQSFLKKIIADCAIARKAGVKLIIRFGYTWLQDKQDTNRQQILAHLEQLKPIFNSNYDAIAYLEAGFIGLWGEWHSSSNRLDNTEDRRAILFKLLSVLPQERMVALRYVKHKKQIYNNEHPLSDREAFNRTYRARTGAHNQCFLASSDDWGTYSDTNPQIIDREKTFLNLDNRYVVQGGEVCNSSPYDDCSNALKELARMRWSTLNFKVFDGREILEDWQKQGCWQEIEGRLGYRFRLLQGKFPERAVPRGSLTMELEIINEGWASPYNPRLLEIVLKNKQTKTEYYLSLREDPRRWLPGMRQRLIIIGGLPSIMESGQYQVFFNLPDPTSKLYGKASYSIRLANQNMWDFSTGYNDLGIAIKVSKDYLAPKYSGTLFFKKRSQ